MTPHFKKSVRDHTLGSSCFKNLASFGSNILVLGLIDNRAYLEPSIVVPVMNVCESNTY